MKKEKYYNVIKKPLLTEKTTAMTGEEKRNYAFEVALDSSKEEIKEALENLFEVKVADVNTAIVRGKTKKRQGRIAGKKSNWKKAYVTLKEGTIGIFEEM